MTVTLVARLALALLFVWGAAGAWAQVEPQRADIRLVVDVSGSMKRTDPDNLRRPALELLVRLLPSDSRAGVWTFGQQVNELVPHGGVDENWKERALAQVDAIDSVALYTHIGAALEAAASDRDEREPDAPPADILLLTDGMVDVSPDAEVSARERDRVLNELVPSLAEAGYRIHTIGLSDEADEALLRQMARRADGLFSRARSAEQLMDSLLRLFQQSVPTEQLPMEDGQFLVDESIREFTALIRREEGTGVTLTDPQGRDYRAGDTGPGMRWHAAPRYDLVTVTDPEPGRWSSDADPHPRSRLTIVSNLQLVVEPLPNNLHAGEPMALRFHLRDREGRIDSAELLSVLDWRADIRRGEGGPALQRERWHGEPPADGRHQFTFSAPDRPGDYRLRLALDGKSFERLYEHRFAVASPFSVSLEKIIEQEQVRWRVEVEADGAVDPERTDLVARVYQSGDQSRIEALTQPEPGLWVYELVPSAHAHYRIALRASGQTRSGQRFEQQLPSQYLHFPEPGDPQPDPVGEAIETLRGELEAQQQSLARARRGEATEPPPVTLTLGSEPEPPAPPPEPAPQNESSGVHPALLVGSLVVANGLLLALAYFGYRLIMSGAGRSETEREAGDAEAPGDAQAPAGTPTMQQIDTGGQEPPPKPPKPEESKPAEKPRPDEKESDSPAPSETDEDDEPLFPLDDDEDEDRSR